MIGKVYNVMRRILVTGMVWKSGIVVVMKMSILRYFDELEGISCPCEDVLDGKNRPSVLDPHNRYLPVRAVFRRHLSPCPRNGKRIA